MSIKDRIKRWLEVPEETSMEEVISIKESMRKELEKARGDISFWRQQLRKRTPKKKCLNCNGEIEVWPFNDKVGYYLKGNKVEHVTCPKGE